VSSHQIANSTIKTTHEGKLIVFEGGEGCGKTTQLGEIASWLKSSGWLARLQPARLGDLLITREPGGTKLCSDIRQLLLTPHDELMTSTTELLLYAADRAQHVEGCLRPALDQGQIVLCDRYTDSTMAYQGYGRGLDQNLITQLNTIATGGVRSDLTLWLDLDVAVGLARAKGRGKRDRIEEADFTFHQRVHQGFAALAKQEPNRVVRIDASLSKVEVTREIIKALEDRFISWIQPSNPLGSEMRSVSQPQSNESFHLVQAC
jgi:dTMP kinase